jgi:hypothetical protein
MATRKWLPIVAGIVVFVVILGVGLVGGCVYMVKRQVSVRTLTSATEGKAELDRLRTQMAGQKAFIELPEEDSDAAPVIHRELATQPTGKVTTVHVRIWAPRDRKLIRVDVPFWLLRLMGNGPINIQTGDSDFGGVSLKVTPVEIERRGPGLLLDHTEHRGNQVLVWTE